MTAQRPALADVLDTLTPDTHCRGWWRAEIAAGLPLFALDADGVTCATTRVRWAHSTPAPALAALVEAELLPEHWADEGRAPRWWCERCSACGGSGEIVAPPARLWPAQLSFSPCPACIGGTGTPVPPSHAALVAVASLGPDTLARAEAIVAETWPGARLVWRVMTAEELNAALRKACETPTVDSRVAFWFACEAVGLWSDRWPEEFRFWSASDAPPEAVALMDERRRLYPTLRALAVTEDGKPTGLCLVALDDARVVLAVEAL